jgi:hypothetical protein
LHSNNQLEVKMLPLSRQRIASAKGERLANGQKVGNKIHLNIANETQSAHGVGGYLKLGWNLGDINQCPH